MFLVIKLLSDFNVIIQRFKELEFVTALSHKPLVIICHNIRSLYNVGSVFRIADAFGVNKVFLSGYTGTPKNFRLAKTALGAEKTIHWEYGKHLKKILDKLRQGGFQIVALENNVTKTTSIEKFKPKFPLALLLGEEVNGTDNKYLKMCDKIIEIPMVGKKESLNVSVAAGIATFYLNQFRK